MSYYIPSLIPEEDRKLLQKYQSGKVRRVGFGSRPAVIVVDVNRAFVEDRFPSGYAKTAIPAVRAIKRLLDVAREHKFPVIYVTGMRSEEEDRPAIRGRWIDKSSPLPEELLQEADEVYPEITPQKGDAVIRKAKPSAFFGTQLVGILNFFGVDTIIVTGLVTSGCVRATVVDGFSYNYKVIVPQECVGDRINISHEVALFDIDMKYCDVMKLDEVIKALKSIKKT